MRKFSVFWVFIVFFFFVQKPIEPEMLTILLMTVPYFQHFLIFYDSYLLISWSIFGQQILRFLKVMSLFLCFCKCLLSLRRGFQLALFLIY